MPEFVAICYFLHVNIPIMTHSSYQRDVPKSGDRKMCAQLALMSWYQPAPVHTAAP